MFTLTTQLFCMNDMQGSHRIPISVYDRLMANGDYLFVH